MKFSYYGNGRIDHSELKQGRRAERVNEPHPDAWYKEPALASMSRRKAGRPEQAGDEPGS
jgi:hypothetical protein